MRQLFVAAVVLAAVGVLQAAAPQDKKGTIKGLHMCCGACVNSVQQILGKVEGVSDAKCDRKTKSVSFTAKDQKAVLKALAALEAGGFGPTEGEYDNTAFKKAIKAASGSKTTSAVNIQGVHACCGACNGAIKALFKDSQVTITGKGAQKDLRITGKDLDAAQVLTTLQQAGFYGIIVADKKK